MNPPLITSHLLCAAVESLMTAAVKNYAEIEKRIAQGTKNRTLASTNMNATSRFAHEGLTVLTKTEWSSVKKLLKLTV